MLWLFKTYVLSAGMYASQMWSTQFLKHDNGFKPFAGRTHGVCKENFGK